MIKIEYEMMYREQIEGPLGPTIIVAVAQRNITSDYLAALMADASVERVSVRL